MLITPIFIYLFISLLLLNFQWKENKFVLYFIAIILIYCFRNLTTAYSFDNNNLIKNPTLLTASDLLTYLTGPMTLYLFKSLIRDKFVIDLKLVILCFPMVLFFINVLPELNLFSVNNSQTLFWSLDSQLKLISASNFCFMVISFYHYFKAKKAQLLKPINNYYLKAVVVIYVITSAPRVILILSILSFSNLRKEIENLYLTNNHEILYFITILTPLSVLLFPKLVYGGKSNSILFQSYKQLTNSLTKEATDLDSTFSEQSTDLERIVSYMEMKKAYLKPDFSLHTISRDLNIPLLRVSKCFNKDLKVSFIEYRNRKRVEYSITLFEQNVQKNMSIEGISLKCGFKNRVSYYNAFRAIHRQTPLEWIKKNI